MEKNIDQRKPIGNFIDFHSKLGRYFLKGLVFTDCWPLFRPLDASKGCKYFPSFEHTLL